VLAAPEALRRLPDHCPGVRCLYDTDRGEVRRLHLVGLLPGSRPLQELRPLVQEALAAIEQDTGAPLRGVEVYPDPDKPVRLPFGDCLTVTDEGLNRDGEVDLQAHVVRLLAFV